MIDEVIGVKGLPSFRVFSEQASELAKQEQDEKAKAAAQGQEKTATGA